MCGRYLIEEEAYSDILEILCKTGMHGGGGAVPGGGSAVPGNAVPGTDTVPAAIREAMANVIRMKSGNHGNIDETVPQAFENIFHGRPEVVLSGEVYPTNIVPVYAQDGIKLIKWGFKHWKNSSVIINARAETAFEKRMFRTPLTENRCVVPASGFYEWGSSALCGGSGELDDLQIGMLGSGHHENYDYSRKRRSRKTKYLLRHADSKKLYMAGFWNTFTDAQSGDEYPAFVILTTAASPGVSRLHDRMPVILSADEKDEWLGDIGFVQYVMMRPGPELTITAA